MLVSEGETTSNSVLRSYFVKNLVNPPHFSPTVLHCFYFSLNNSVVVCSGAISVSGESKKA